MDTEALIWHDTMTVPDNRAAMRWLSGLFIWRGNSKVSAAARLCRPASATARGCRNVALLPAPGLPPVKPSPDHVLVSENGLCGISPASWLASRRLSRHPKAPSRHWSWHWQHWAPPGEGAQPCPPWRRRPAGAWAAAQVPTTPPPAVRPGCPGTPRARAQLQAWQGPC
jgi:hypothetical protein